MEEYLQNYEKMLQEGSHCTCPLWIKNSALLPPGIAPEMGAPLDQVDHEGGITTRPEPGFVEVSETATGSA